MHAWENILYDAKKDFYLRSSISPAHIKLRKALDIVEKEIKPISKELEEKKKETDGLKAALSDALTQLRLAQYQKDKEIDTIKKDLADKLIERLQEKESLYTIQINDYEQRIKALQKSLRAAQEFTQKLEAEKTHIEYSSTQNIQKILDLERLENNLVLKRKDEDIQSLQDRLIGKEDTINDLMVNDRDVEKRYMNSQKQWINEIQFSREILKKTIEEMDALQHEYVKRESEVIQDLQDQLLESRKHLTHLETDLPNQRVNIIQLELDEKNDLLKSYQDENTVLQETVQRLRNDTDSIENLKQDNQKLVEKTTPLEQSNTRLNAEVDTLHAQIVDYEDDIEAYKQKTADAQSQLTGIDEKQTVEFEQTNALLKEEKEKLSAAFNKEKEELTARLETTDTTIADLKKRVLHAEDKVRSAQTSAIASLPDIPTAHFNFLPDLPSEEQPIPSEETKTTVLPKKKIILRRLAAAASILVVVGITVYISKQILWSPGSSSSKTIDQSYNALQQNPSALIWDGLTFWSTDWYAKKIFKHKSRSLSEVTQTIQLDTIIPTNITWGEGSLWVNDSWAHTIYRLAPDDNYRIEGAYTSPGHAPSGLAWDGLYMWSCDAETQKIYCHNTDQTLSLVQTYDAPGTAPSGLLWDGDALWSCDSDTGMIYRHRMDYTLSVAVAYQPRDYKDGKDTLISFTWDGKYFWTVGEKSNKFYRHSIHDMEKQE